MDVDCRGGWLKMFFLMRIELFLPPAVIGGGALLWLWVLPLQIPVRSCGSCRTLGPEGWTPRRASGRPRCANARDETSSKTKSAVNRRVN